MELFNKKYVYFIWDSELEGKNVFVSNNIEAIIDHVNNGLEPQFVLSEKEFENWTFAYYDPNLECKKAFKEGKQIQCRTLGSQEHNWGNVDGEPLWDERLEYRIKPEKEARPFESLQELFQHWQTIIGCEVIPNTMPLIWIKSKNQVNSKIEFISGFNLDEDKVVILNTLYNIYSLKDMFENFTFLDGTPFGVVL